MTTKRYTPDDFKRLADGLEGSSIGPWLANMFKQAAEDCEDAYRYRWLRGKQDGSARKGKRDATVIFWGDEPYEPNMGIDLDEAIDRARTQEQAK